MRAEATVDFVLTVELEKEEELRAQTPPRKILLACAGRPGDGRVRVVRRPVPFDLRAVATVARAMGCRLAHGLSLARGHRRSMRPARKRSASRTQPMLAVALAWMSACSTPRVEVSEAPHGGAHFRLRVGAPGLDYVNLSGDAEQLSVLEQNGQGLALADFDGDGRVDLFVTQGGTFELWRRGELPGSRLYRNLGGWRFADVTPAAGFGAPMWGTGAAAADFDGDGRPDLYVAGWGGDRLYRNRGGGAFEDVTARLGSRPEGWSSSVAVADFDRDERLDVYVSRYVVFDPARIPDREADGGDCLYRGVVTGCGPWRYSGERDLLYLQRPDGTFAEAAEPWGLAVTAACRGMGVAPGDFDDDGDADVYVACDVGPNLYLENVGGSFAEVGSLRGGALNEDGRHESGMGVAIGDLLGHGRLDIVSTNFAGEKNTLYENRAGDLFDRSSAVGLGLHQQELGWGVAAADFDLDGRRDLLLVNGHIYPQVEALGDPADRYAQPPRLYLGVRSGRWVEVPPERAFVGERDLAASGRAPAFSLRSLAAGDLDDDGDLDLVAVQHNGPLVLFENLSPRRARSLVLIGPGGAGSPHGAVAAAGSWRHAHWPTHGYQSSHDPRVLAPEDAQEIDVRWPDSRCERFSLPAGDAPATLRSGRGEPVDCASAHAGEPKTRWQ